MKTSVCAFALVLAMAPALGASAAGTTSELDPAVLESMTINQFVSQGKAKLAEMNEFVKQALETLSGAKSENDFEKMKCIETNLDGIKGLLRVSDHNAVTLSERAIAQDRTGASREFVKIAIAHGRVLALMNAVKGCGGTEAETIFAGEPVVETMFDKDLPKDYSTGALTDFCQALPCDMEPPPSASPFN